MSEYKKDFFVIYNWIQNPKEATDDSKTSLQFTEYLVKLLEDRGLKGYYADRDVRPGSTVFNELLRNTSGSRRIILVVTPAIVRDNNLAIYSTQVAYKELIDANQCDKLIPIGIDISETEKLEELKAVNWVYFPKDWSFDSNRNNWNKILQAVSKDGPLKQQPAVHTQEHVDDRLRTDNENLVVQPSSLNADPKEFLTGKFLMKLGQKFPSDWKILAIHLGLQDHVVTEVERNNPGTVHLQAYNALLRWKNQYGESEAKKVEYLVSTLKELGRRDLVEEIKAQFTGMVKEIKAQLTEFNQRGLNDTSTKWPDEVDKGMSRNRFDQTSVKQKRREQVAANQGRNSAGGITQHSTYMARDLKPEIAVIDIEATSRSADAVADTDSVQLQQGLSMSLPPAPVVSPPSKQVNKPPNHTVNGETKLEQTTQAPVGHHSTSEVVDNSSDTCNFSKTGGQGAMGFTPIHEEQISATKAKTVSQKMTKLDVQAAHQLVGDTNDNCNSKRKGEQDYKSQQSLTADTDLTADAFGSFSYNKESSAPGNILPTKKPNELDLHNVNKEAPSLDVKSLNAAGSLADSGYFCSTEPTPIDDQVIPDRNQSEPRLQNSPDKTTNQSLSDTETSLVVESMPCQKQTGTMSENISTDKSISRDVGLDKSKEKKKAAAELDTSLSSQGKQQSLVSKISLAALNIITNSHLAYN